MCVIFKNIISLNQQRYFHLRQTYFRYIETEDLCPLVVPQNLSILFQKSVSNHFEK